VPFLCFLPLNVKLSGEKRKLPFLDIVSSPLKANLSGCRRLPALP
jgi:hypothetical protein